MTEYNRNKDFASASFYSSGYFLVKNKLLLSSLYPAPQAGKIRIPLPLEAESFAALTAFQILFLSLKSLPVLSTEMCLLASLLILHIHTEFL